MFLFCRIPRFIPRCSSVFSTRIGQSDILAIRSQANRNSSTLTGCPRCHVCTSSLLITRTFSLTSIRPTQDDYPVGNNEGKIITSLQPHVDKVYSHAYGRSTKELRYYTIGPMMEAMAKQEPNLQAMVVVDEGISKTFEELNGDVNRLVNGLVDKYDLKRGDKVGLYSYNNYQYVLVQLACNKLGLIFNPINPSYKSREFNYVLNKSDAKVLFLPGKNSKQSPLNDQWSILCDESLREAQKKGSISHLREIIILEGDYEEKELKLENVKINSWNNILSSNLHLDQCALERVAEVRTDDISGVYYTSGTTGFPKGATVTQFNLINNTALSCDRMFSQRGPNFKAIRPTLCIPLPLFHQFGGTLGLLTLFTHSATIVLTGMRYNIQSVVESIIKFNCNSLYLTPTILIDLIKYVDINKISDFPLKFIYIAGSPVMPELVHKSHKILTNLEELRIGYGSSENGVIASCQTSEELAEDRPLTVGPPLDFSEIRIADTKTGRTTLLGQPGEVQTRGFNTMLGYYNDPEKSKEVLISSRWYRTGDLGIINKHGSLQIVGRIKDLIIKGGENIYPAEVETVLHTHSAIEDAYVIGVPDERFGEEVCVWVKLKKSNNVLSEEEMKKDIVDYCKKSLSYYKVPKYVIFVEEFPLTPIKKVKKYVMREETTKMLNLA